MSPHFARALRFAETSEKAGAWTLAELHRLAFEFQETHDLAISAAATKATDITTAWGGGEMSADHKALAEAIRDMRVDK